MLQASEDQNAAMAAGQVGGCLLSRLPDPRSGCGRSDQESFRASKRRSGLRGSRISCGRDSTPQLSVVELPHVILALLLDFQKNLRIHRHVGEMAHDGHPTPRHQAASVNHIAPATCILALYRLAGVLEVLRTLQLSHVGYRKLLATAHAGEL